MKIIMYHYVQEGDPELPFFRYLHVSNFRKQLDHFESVGRLSTFLDASQFIENGSSKANEFLLTFDDGLSDHYQYVFPELLARGSSGLFFVNTAPWATGKLLAVHRIHYLIGKLGGKEVLNRLIKLIPRDVTESQRAEALRQDTYQNQMNDDETTEVKRILNYYLNQQDRDAVLDVLFDDIVDEAVLCQRFYLTQAQAREMAESGMILASHTHTHPVLSDLTLEAQSDEISQGITSIENAVGEISAPRIFCYPYGGPKSFTEVTMGLLKEHGVSCAFAVNAKDCAPTEFDGLRLKLPRYDCNMFPNGTASLG